MIRARFTSEWGMERERVTATSCSRSAGESLNSRRGRPRAMGLLISPSMRLRPGPYILKLFMGHHTSRVLKNSVWADRIGRSRSSRASYSSALLLFRRFRAPVAELAGLRRPDQGRRLRGDSRHPYQGVSGGGQLLPP